MGFDIKSYYEEMLNKSSNPDHKTYYYNMLHGNDIEEAKNKSQRIYSKKLDMYFDTMAEASRFIGKSDTYVYMILRDGLPNHYEFSKVD